MYPWKPDFSISKWIQTPDRPIDELWPQKHPQPLFPRYSEDTYTHGHNAFEMAHFLLL